MKKNDTKSSNNQQKIKYNDKKYDVFFSHMVKDIDSKYLDRTGRIKLEAKRYGGVPFKSFSIQVASKKKDQDQPNKLYTEVFTHGFGYEFDINDRNFNIINGSYDDLGSNPETMNAINSVQTVAENNQYIKEASCLSNYYQYYWNEKLSRTKGTDLRDVLIPKIVSRLEDTEEVVNKGIKDAEELTEQVYATHKNNCSHNSSFTDTEYGFFKKCSTKDEYLLRSMNLHVNKNSVDFTGYNEVLAAPISQDKEWVLPKRLIINISCGIENEPFIKFCEANKIYKSDIRLINSEDRQTQVVTPKQFKKILEDSEMFADLNKEAQDKLDEMINVYEENEKDIANKKVSDLYNQQQKDTDNNEIETKEKETTSSQLPYN